MQSEWKGIARTSTQLVIAAFVGERGRLKGLGGEQLDVGLNHSPRRVAQPLGVEVGAERTQEVGRGTLRRLTIHMSMAVGFDDELQVHRLCDFVHIHLASTARGFLPLLLGRLDCLKGDLLFAPPAMAPNPYASGVDWAAKNPSVAARNTAILAFRNTRGISSLTNTLSSDVGKVFNATWSVRDGQVVPKTEDVVLANGAVKLHAVVLYADLARSTQLAMRFDCSVAAKIVRAYLSSMTRLVNSSGGVVRSFDGDRVMGVFIGGSKNSNAAECALKMNYLVTKILRPKAEVKFPSLVSKGFRIKHCVGISRSNVLVVRGGVRGSNDLVFVGAAPNIAAKLSEIRNSNWHSYITKSVYGKLNHDAKFSRSGENMWTAVSRKIAGESWSVYKSSWWREP